MEAPQPFVPVRVRPAFGNALVDLPKAHVHHPYGALIEAIYGPATTSFRRSAGTIPPWRPHESSRSHMVTTPTALSGRGHWGHAPGRSPELPPIATLLCAPFGGLASFSCRTAHPLCRAHAALEAARRASFVKRTAVTPSTGDGPAPAAGRPDASPESRTRASDPPGQQMQCGTSTAVSGGAHQACLWTQPRRGPRAAAGPSADQVPVLGQYRPGQPHDQREEGDQ